MSSEPNPNNLDRNIGKLLAHAPEPEAPRPGAGDRVFADVMGRLAADRRSTARRRVLAWAGAAVGVAAAAAAILIALAWRPAPVQPWPKDQSGGMVVREIRPAAGASARQELADGSVLAVAGGSVVKVTTWSDRARPLVELSQGEVTCDVAKGLGRFTVKTPVGEAIALGTKYSVKLEGPASAGQSEGDAAVKTRNLAAALVMTVTVLSGEVLVRDLAGHEQLALAGAPAVKVGEKPAQVAEVDKFKSGQLVPRLADGRQGQPLEVRRHAVQVTIREQIAFVEVDQTFFNPSNQRLEGTFYFPLPAGSTISRLAMYIGDNLMEGEIAEAQRARRTFEALLIQQQDPALLEWAGGNNFKMRVFPIEARSEKRVLISYYQVLKRENGRIGFSYPLVSDSLQTHPVGKIEIKATVDSTPEILDAKTPGYKTELTAGKNHLELSYGAEKAAPEKDFNLEYRVARGQGELVVVPYWHGRDGEGYFLMIFSPELEEIDSEKTRSSRFVFVLDKSGGLGAQHLALGVKAVKSALAALRPGDQFGIVAYDAFARKFKKDTVAASAGNVKAAGEWLEALEALGASDLGAAWKAAADLAGKGQTQMIYVGSGLSTLTSTKTGKLLADAEKALAGHDVRVHGLSLGNVQDGQFLAELVKKYSGTVRPLGSAEDLAAHVGELLSDYGWPLYENVRMEFEGAGVNEIYPVWFPNVTAGRQLFAFGKYLNQGKATVRLTASYKDKPYAKQFAVDLAGDRANNFVPKLWATRKIEHLQQESALADSDRADALVRTVIETSKRYRVMSQYTSFIVLETAEDYLRFGIERRADEFSGKEEQLADFQIAEGGFGGGGPGNQAGQAEGKDGAFKALKEEKQQKSLARESEALRRAPADRENVHALAEANSMKDKAANAAPPAPAAKAPARELSKADSMDGDGYRSAGERKRAESRGAGSDFDTDVLAWARRDIFPIFGSTELGSLPRDWKPSDAKAMEVLKGLAGRFESLALKVSAFSLDKEGKETKQGREWTVVFDAGTGAFTSYKLGDDHKDVSEGAVRFQLFPTLKYAAKRAATKSDLFELMGTLPGYLAPWAEKLDREWLVTVEKQEEGGPVVLKLVRRWAEHTYTLLYLDSDKGPISKIEVFEQRWNGKDRYAFKARTIACEEVKEVGGVKVPTVFKTVNHSETAGKAARDIEELKKMVEKLRAEGQNEQADAIMRKLGTAVGTDFAAAVVRLSDLKVNFKPEAEAFKVELPKDWAVRSLEAAPKGEDVKPVSPVVNPSPNMGGNWGGRRMRE
jgi:hypothetical protein